MYKTRNPYWLVPGGGIKADGHYGTGVEPEHMGARDGVSDVKPGEHEAKLTTFS